MIYLLILTIILVILYLIFKPFIDIFDDYRGEHHIIIWYDRLDKKRGFINIIGGQQWPPIFVSAYKKKLDLLRLEEISLYRYSKSIQRNEKTQGSI